MIFIYDHMRHIDDEPSIGEKIERLYKAYQDPSLVKHRAYICFDFNMKPKSLMIEFEKIWIDKGYIHSEMQRCFFPKLTSTQRFSHVSDSRVSQDTLAREVVFCTAVRDKGDYIPSSQIVSMISNCSTDRRIEILHNIFDQFSGLCSSIHLSSIPRIIELTHAILSAFPDSLEFKDRNNNPLIIHNLTGLVNQILNSNSELKDDKHKMQLLDIMNAIQFSMDNLSGSSKLNHFRTQRLLLERVVIDSFKFFMRF